MASNKKRNNLVLRIMDDTKEQHAKEKDIAKVFLDYFESIFQKSCPTNMDQICQTMDTKVTNDANTTLLREFTIKEIKTALNQMHPDKAPSLDGMTICFYKKY